MGKSSGAGSSPHRKVADWDRESRNSAAAGAGSDGRDDGAPGREVLAAAFDHRSLLSCRGIAALVFAFLVFFWPKLTLTGLATLWAAYSLVDAVLALAAAFMGRRGTPRSWLILIGLAGTACAGGTLIAIDEVSAHLAGIISIWAIITGAMQVWVARELRRAVAGNWILVLDGVGVLLLGLALALLPNLQADALPWLIGWFAAANGGLLLSISYWLGRAVP